MFGSTLKTYGKRKSSLGGSQGITTPCPLSTSTSNSTATTNRPALGQITNLPTLFETDDEASPLMLDSPSAVKKPMGRRNAKRDNPGTPHDEVPTATKTSRLFSPPLNDKTAARGRLQRSATYTLGTKPKDGTTTKSRANKNRLRRSSTCSSIMSIDPEENDEGGRGTQEDDNDQGCRRMSIRSSRSSRPTPMSLSTTAVKRQSKSVMALNVAEQEDVDFLMESTKAEQGLKFGFGKGFIVRPPDDWEVTRRQRFRSLCEALGFKSQVIGTKICYQMSTTLIAKLRRQLCELRPVPPLDLPAGPLEQSKPAASEGACILRLEDIMASEELSPPVSPRRPQMRRKRSSFMLSPGAFMALEDSSPSPEDRVGSLPPLSQCSMSPVPHQQGEDDVTQAPEQDTLLDEVAESFGALALGGAAMARRQLRSSQESASRGASTEPPKDPTAAVDDPTSPFFSDTSHDCDQPFEIRTIPECLHQVDQDRSSSDSSPHGSAQVTVSFCSITSSAGRVSAESFCSTFATPTIVKRQPRPPRPEHDWGLSKGASPAILQALQRRLDEGVAVEISDEMITTEIQVPSIMHRGMTMMQRVQLRESLDCQLPPPECRYSSNNRASVDSLNFEMDHLQALPCQGRRSGGKDAELRRKQSVAKARRVSIGLQARAASLSLARRPRMEQSLAPVRDLSLSTVRSSIESQSSAISALSPLIKQSEATTIHDLDRKLLSRTFGFLPPHEVITVLPFVCKAWTDAALHARAAMLSDLDDTSPGVQRDWDWVVSCLPCGVFLSDGAFKSVFKVWCATQKRDEAISVMDINFISQLGDGAIVMQELHASILVSSLVRRAICPNFVEIYDTFRSDHIPTCQWSHTDGSYTDHKRDLARSSKRKPPNKRQSSPGSYQFIRMELCDHGDIEGFIRRQPEGLLPLDVVQQLLFQMCFSLYAARESFSMRHYDVKLLNFFLRRFPSRGASVRYGFGPHVYRLTLPESYELCVKLADFGTADLSAENLGQPVGVEQFTTLENTPVEYLVNGGEEVQDFTADTFSLGLAVLHLFVGSAPYEEVMEEVQCPDELFDALTAIWDQKTSKGEPKPGPYRLISDVIHSGDEPDEVLHHTLYRYLVLCGIPEEVWAMQGTGGWRGAKGKNVVWSTVAKLIGPREALTRGGARGRGGKKGQGSCKPALTKKAMKVTEQYWRDFDRYNLEKGDHPLIERGRERLEALPGAYDLLRRMMDFDPSKRITVSEALSGPVFEGLREDIGDEPCIGSMDYMAYWRGSDECLGKPCLPIL